MGGERRLFLAHSSADKAIATELRRLVLEDPALGVDVFLDAESIPAGESWSEAIEDALLDCCAALFLFTENALTAPYMPHEAFLLSLRKRFDRDVHLIPVFLDGFQPARLTAGDSPFRYSKIETAQGITTTRDELGDVAAELRRRDLSSADWIPWRSVERKLADALSNLSDEGVEQAVETLEILTPEGDLRSVAKLVAPNRWLARRVFRLDLVELRDFVQRLAPFLDPEDGKALIQTAMPFAWVDSDGARQLADAAGSGPTRNAVGLNFKRLRDEPEDARADRCAPYVPELYARRACACIPHWRVLKQKASWSHEVEQDVHASMIQLARELVQDQLGFMDEAELKQALEDLRNEGCTALVVLPEEVAQTDNQLLSAMTEFSKALVFLVTTEHYDPELSARFPDIVQLPELTRDDQVQLHSAWGVAWRAVHES